MILYCTRCGILTHFLSMGFDLLIYFCACVCSHKSGHSAMAPKTTRRAKKRKPRKQCKSIRVIYKHFFIMEYFKNKLNTWKETFPANFDGLGVQGHRSQISNDLILVLFLMTVCLLSPVKKKMKVSFHFAGDPLGWWADNFLLEVPRS